MNNLNNHISLINKIKHLEVQIAQILQYSEEAIISTDDKYNIILFNNGAENIFGYRREEIIGKHLNTLIPTESHAAHAKHMADYSKHELHSKPVRPNNHISGLRKDGTQFYAEASISVVTINSSKVFTVFLRDITNRQSLERELKFSHEKFESIIRIANDAIINVDNEFRITLFNEGAERIFGYSEQEMIGEPLNILIPEPYRDKHEKLMKDFAATPNFSRMMGQRQEIIGLRRDRIEFHAEASIANVYINSKPNFTVILRDVSSRKLLEKQLIKYLTELELIDNEKERYFTILAHDLRNPFGNLLGYIDYILDNINDLDKGDILDLLKASSISAKNIYNLLESLLDWTRLQMNRISFKPVQFDASEKFEKALLLYQAALESKNLIVTSKIDKNCIVYADPDMFYTIIRNLISNAIKYSFEKSKIEIEYENDEETTTIIISDSGIGMDKDTFTKLFRTDSKANTFGTKGESGFGIGLLLVKDFIEINHGWLHIESEYKVGSKISFTLPSKAYT